MRRFSQKNSLVTLNEINITPLLDLAFVLLIIFVITTPLLEQSLKLNLPSGGFEAATKIRKEDVRTVEVSPDGNFVMGGRRMSLNDVEAVLVKAFSENPRLTVYIRADSKEDYGNVLAVLNRCEKNNINRVAFATKPDK
ncbi:MAG: biopolymer transporter ExbD [Verrucomicrobiota bacterium]|nr:biopolymer transporter ExbD [Verrucomicrobiota bacterium]